MSEDKRGEHKMDCVRPNRSVKGLGFYLQVTGNLLECFNEGNNIINFFKQNQDILQIRSAESHYHNINKEHSLGFPF